MTFQVVEYIVLKIIYELYTKKVVSQKNFKDSDSDNVFVGTQKYARSTSVHVPKINLKRRRLGRGGRGTARWKKSRKTEGARLQ